MGYLKIFFGNTAMLIAVAYLANLIYKSTISNASVRIKKVSWVLLAIFAGWISTLFGYRLDEHVIFDLRFVPLIISTLAYPHPFILVLIGIGTGLTRLTFGVNEAAMAGTINLSILGFVCAALSYWVRRSSLCIVNKGLIVILVVNVMNAINIMVFGVIPAPEYIREIMPITFPAGLILSVLFSLIIRDFQLGLLRNVQIQRANEQLSAQTEELHKNKIALEERADQLMMASQFKSEFLANMSHELRTPLNSIINLSQLIEDNDNSLTEAEMSEYAAIIRRSGEELLMIIGDILDLSKVEAGRLDIINEDLSVIEIPEILAMQFAVTAKQKELEFTIAMEENIPQMIHSDPQRIQQILRNLLSNAFKFTKSGHVALRIRQEERGEGAIVKHWIVFEVEDSGIGIAPEKHAMIFEAFQQADRTISRKYGGTGLGLSISNDLARLLGGFITLESEEGKGSRFSLYLPLEFIEE
ncbi:sensor histidine kinase [Paenibacillus odorifer]|uniref:ATP-binding protein n=1 Tax=Paenibacillus TaxID=44249 RepID=UPI00097000B2|nr:ATP-binding protein [Paenibacillus odorifer]OMD92435.1 sensor histidine kinase [Paenibacillus odorifer]